MYVNDPKVSIYISTYNRLEKLKRAINSVFAQD
ncbi:glycosyl transferase family 2, partial [Klebsiella michiganensis]